MIVEQSISEVCVGMYILDITSSKGKFHLVKEGWIESENIIEGFCSHNYKLLRFIEPSFNLLY